MLTCVAAIGLELNTINLFEQEDMTATQRDI